MPRRLLSKIKSKIVEGGRRDFSKNKVFQNLALLRTFGLRLSKERGRALMIKKWIKFPVI